MEGCLAGLKPRVTAKMNHNLLQVFILAKVALKQMHPLKPPGPNGMSTCFYQHSWAIVRDDVCLAVLDFLNNGVFGQSINDTFITLIPKVKNPSYITEYKPISLCNAIYKLIARC